LGRDYADDDDEDDEDEENEDDGKPPSVSPLLTQQQSRSQGALAVFSLELPRDSIVGHLPPPPFIVGDHVELQGLSSQAFNGQRGILIYDHGNQRYQIKLDSGEEVRVRDINLRKLVDDKKPEMPKNKSNEHAGKKKICQGTTPKGPCVTFAVSDFDEKSTYDGNYCLRHQYQSYYQPYAPPAALAKGFQVASEIVSTEGTYKEGLKSAKAFHADLCARADLGRPLIPAQAIDVIFSNLPQIFELSDALHTDMKEAMINRVLIRQIGATLLHYVPQFRLYQMYLEGYDGAVRELAVQRQAKPEFELWIQIMEKVHNSSLASLLILPVQRLPRYVLLMKELHKQLPDQEPVKMDVADAISRLSNITSNINKSLHQADASAKVQALEDLFDKSDKRFRPLVAPGRALIFEGDLVKGYSAGSAHITSGTRYHFCLLSDVLIYAGGNPRTKYKLKQVISLNGVKASKEAAPDKFVVHGGSKPLTLTAATPALRDAWVDAITKQVLQNQAEDQSAMMGATLDGKTTNKRNDKLAKILLDDKRNEKP